MASGPVQTARGAQGAREQAREPQDPQERKPRPCFCAVEIEPASEADRRQYVQLLYDRDPGITEELDSWNTTYDDFVRVLRFRISGLWHAVKARRAERRAAKAAEEDR